jgi:endonuclease III
VTETNLKQKEIRREADKLVRDRFARTLEKNRNDLQDINKVLLKNKLEDSLPREYWSYADNAFLHLGKEYCKAKKPRCYSCPLKELCKYGKESQRRPTWPSARA